MACKYDPVLMQIGNRIVRRREELNMKQNELAIQADLNAVTLSRIESGQVDVKASNLVKIAKVLKVPFSYLQPEILDGYSEMDREKQSLVEELTTLPVAEQMMLIKMFKAQIQTRK